MTNLMLHLQVKANISKCFHFVNVFSSGYQQYPPPPPPPAADAGAEAAPAPDAGADAGGEGRKHQSVTAKKNFIFFFSKMRSGLEQGN